MRLSRFVRRHPDKESDEKEEEGRRGKKREEEGRRGKKREATPKEILQYLHRSSKERKKKTVESVTNMEFDLGCQSISMIDDRHAVLAVPAVDLDASAATAEDGRIHLLGGVALKLIAREVCVV
jgi:hypothetical protein